MGGDCILLTPFTYKVEVGYVPNQFNLEQASITFPDLPYVGNLKAGQFQPPMGLDLITSSRDLAFMEPAAPLQALGLPIEAGVQVGRPICDRRATWALGIFSQGAGPSDYGASAEYGNLIVRLTWLAIDQLDPDHPARNQYLHLGISGDFQFASSSTVQYRSRPESHIPPRVIDTGKIDASRSGTFGFESAWVDGPYLLQAEALDSVVEPDAGGTLNFYGFYALVGWYVTGESRPYDRQSGAFQRLIPQRDFNFGRGGGWGAVQLACRVSYTDLTDGDVSGGRLGLVMGELNWYLHSHVRWMLNAGAGHVTGGKSDGDMYIFQTRIGVDF